MVKTTTEIRRIINDFAQALEPTLRVSKIVLFGSYAYGTPHEWSDIDVAILSPNFRGLNTLQRQRLISCARAGKFYDSMIEPLGYTCDEFRRAHHLTFLGEIKRTGKIIWERNKHHKRKQPPKPRRAATRA